MAFASLKGNFGEIELLGSSPVSWRLREGVRPNIQEFDVIPSFGASIIAAQAPLTLTIQDVNVEFLYPIKLVAGENPNIARIVLADRRIWWSYKWIRRFYNFRRNVGVKRIKDPVSPPENLSVVDDVWYAKWSLRNPFADGANASTKWRIQEIVIDIFSTVGKAEEDVSGIRMPPPNTSDINGLTALDVEHLLINDSGDQAIGRVLGYLPEAGVYIDYDGKPRVYSKASGEDRIAVDIARARKTVVGQGDVRTVTNRLLRPQKIAVLFNYEPEIRFDHKEGVTPTVTDDSRFVTNVLQLPDFKLTIRGQEECQGTWVSIDDALVAWGTPPGFTRPLTRDDLNVMMVPYNSFWVALSLAGAHDPDADWMARVAAMQLHYRRTFQIQRHWMDRILGLRAFRVATVNQETGHRAPAIAYSDYCVLTGMRALFNESKQGVPSNDQSYAVNVKGYPIGDAIEEVSKAAPAHVRILDADQGIISLEYLVDPYRLFEAVLPGMVTLKGQENNVDAQGRPLIAGPTADITDRGRPVTWDAVSSIAKNALPTLLPKHNVAIILTAMPGAPNDERVFHRVEVNPSDVQDILPDAARASSTDSVGPVMEIHVGAGLETARVPWLDARAKDIEQLFGIGPGGPTAVDDLVLNSGPITSASGASLSQIARAVAARVWASLADRPEGELATKATPTIKPGGWLSEVEQILNRDGTAYTRLSLPERVKPFDVLSFMDQSTRAMILKLATPDRAE